MRRFWITPLLAAAPQAGCGGREAPISPGEAPETSLAERDALSLHAAAAAGVLDDKRTALAPPSPAEAGNLRIQRTHYAMIREIDAAMQRATSHTTGDTGLTSPPSFAISAPIRWISANRGLHFRFFCAISVNCYQR